MWLKDLLYLLIGLAALGWSGDKLVDYAAAVAKRARLTPTVIGLTVVAMGTSLPELFVSVAASLRGSPEIAVANVVGSNIANVGLILGLVSMVVAIPVARQVLRFDYPVMLLASGVTILACRDQVLDRTEATFFLGALIAFIVYSVYVARRAFIGEEAAHVVEDVAEEGRELADRTPLYLAGGLLMAMAGLGVGAHFLVEGAIGVARLVGISERVIGLTAVAFGTSLPELVASIAAALKRHHEMAVANVVGSNMFNLFMILGVAGLMQPLPIAPEVIRIDLWVMLGITFMLFPLLMRGHKLTRVEGVILTGSYLAYTTYLFIGK